MADVVALKKSRNGFALNFTRAVNSAKSYLEESSPDHIIVSEHLSRVDKRFKVLDDAQMAVPSVVSDSSEDQYIDTYEREYFDVTVALKKLSCSATGAPTAASLLNSNRKSPCTIKLEKVKFEKFDGNIRSYPRFKSDFLKYIAPQYDAEIQPLMLRSLLPQKVAELVRSCKDDLEDHFRVLDYKFGDQGKMSDSILHEIRSFRPTRKEKIIG